ncbi:DUF262 domain-containing protein [Oribacterium parvum]|uniref:DUF262 domain-containing protein n=1 Tax=Oribacterium parvum TaxID=1501329 RepID=UPI0028EEDAC3|nr:DUF262 domain-containing protein [Oribacterium parvum]
MNIRDHEDLASLLKIAQEQDNKINLSLILITVKNNDVENLNSIFEYFRDNGIEIVNEDVEPENINNISENISPFDPSKIDIKMDKLILDSIIKRIKNNELELESSFQRKAGLWGDVQKSQLIESILLKIPLPAFYFDATNDDKWLIIDGLQRISTIKEFVVEDKLKLKGLEFMTDLNGATFSTLPRSLQRRIEETNINGYLINPATPKNVKYNIFKRINTGGLVLEAQEIRNALFQGQATTFLMTMSKSKEFIIATDESIKSDRMLDCEFCLRYVSFANLLSHYNGNMDIFLSEGMEYLQNLNKNELEDILLRFEYDMEISYKIFEKNCFRKVFNDGRRRPINKAIFEAISVVISMSSNEDIKNYISHKEQIKEKFKELCLDYDFINYLKASDKLSVALRIKKIYNIFKNIEVENNDK